MDEAQLHPAIAQVAAAALGPRPADSGGGAPVPRDAQARLLDRLMAEQGPEGVLRAGRHVDTIATEPLVLSLLNSDRPGVLLDKIDRLNRYFHSHHRHRVLELDDHHAVIEHRSTSGDAPTATESLFVCGLYLELLGRVGCRTLTCAFPEAVTGSADVFHDGHPQGVPVAHTARWAIGWCSFQGARSLPGLDEVLLRDLPAELTSSSVGAGVTEILRGDLDRPWKLAAVADRLGVSTRTLQRQLHAEGLSFTEIVRSTRVAAARDLLRDPERTVTEIGYLTGFADTAHLTRTFKAATGVTPSAWRVGAGMNRQ